MKRNKIILGIFIWLLTTLGLQHWSPLSTFASLLLGALTTLLLLRGLLFLQRSAKRNHPFQETAVLLANQDFDLDQIPPCPHCASDEVAIIIYGKPALNRQILTGLESGQIISGGCLVHGGAPRWHCNHCQQDFGHVTIDPSTGAKQ